MITYKAVQATADHKLQIVQLALTEPGPGQVRIRVEACGICYTDSTTIEGKIPGLQYPRVPGHEVVGKIDAVGAGVTAWRVGQRVGVGFLAGACGQCSACRHGDVVNCSAQPYTGVHVDGGYAEVMIAQQTGLVAIPDQLSAIAAAPLLCAGLTTFNALRNSDARPGDLVAIQGLGGLGHLAVQFARHFGFHTVAIARGREKAQLAHDLGAHRYIDSTSEDPAAILQQLGGAKVILTTITDANAMAPLQAGLGRKGKLLVVGAGPQPLQVNTLGLLFGEHAVGGALTGSPGDSEDTLSFSLLQNIKATIETFPLADAPQAYARLMSNQARFRIVLTTGAA